MFLGLFYEFWRIEATFSVRIFLSAEKDVYTVQGSVVKKISRLIFLNVRMGEIYTLLLNLV